MYRVRIIVKEVRGECTIGYRIGDEIIVKKYYIPEGQECKICLHALTGMATLLMPFAKGVSARELGIGNIDDIGYVQCPDPAKPYTEGGTVVFELKREKLES
ncbi:MAG: TIGR04076 family protein [Thermoproteota archaeon]|nr:TIGR04076 family protein [Candidatus Brockarchaeota archaeon]